MMKNKLIYLISVLLVTVVSFSCSDDDDENNDKDLIGTWNYSGKAADIHFELEYNGDEISFPEGLIPSGVLPEGIPGVSETGINVAMIKMALPCSRTNTCLNISKVLNLLLKPRWKY